MSRTPEQKAARRAREQAAKVMKPKVCECCGETYTPKFQFGTKRWESSLCCSRKCIQSLMNGRPENKAKKNAARRGNSELHRREYEQKVARHGVNGSLWDAMSEENKERMRERNRRRYARNYGTDPEYTTERKANASHQRGLRKQAMRLGLLTPEQKVACKQLREEAAALSKALNTKLHVDHIRPLRRGGAEHPGNLQIITAEANLFWGDRIKRCPWPKPSNWDEPPWEPPDLLDEQHMAA